MASVAAQLLHAWQLFELGVPLVHLAALYCTRPPGSTAGKVKQALAFPVAGGPRTFVFQMLSWVS